VVAFDPFPALENIHALSYGVKLSKNLAAVLNQSDIIALHVPLNKKTRGLVNREFIEQMKPGASLINFSRGEIVDDGHVLKALDEGKLTAPGSQHGRKRGKLCLSGGFRAEGLSGIWDGQPLS
jgi:D-3-phosphoglycerate dehydrogenase